MGGMRRAGSRVGGRDGLKDEDSEDEERERKNTNRADKTFGRGSVVLSQSPVDSAVSHSSPAAGCVLVWEYARNVAPFV